MKLRKLNAALHRDLGYFFAGLTIIYAFSGLAVNHVADWNPNYDIEKREVSVGDLPDARSTILAETVLERLKIAADPTSVVRMGEDELHIFFEGRTLMVRLSDGRVLDEVVRKRPGLFEVNFLHLNSGKGFWTWFADLYAIALLLIAGTGLFMITGPRGLGGRGRNLALIGLAIPVIYLFIRL